MVDQARKADKADKKRDLVYLGGRIGAAVCFALYIILGGYRTMADGNILAGALWGFIAGAIGGGAGAAVGMLLEKSRN
jgi:hypothetical protein